MGYYSDVAITLYKRDFETLVKRAAKECKDSLNLIRRATLYKDEGNETVSMAWNGVKWNESFRGINFVMSFLISDDRNFRFKRIGEEIGDIEEACNDEDSVLDAATEVCYYIDMEAAGTKVDSELLLNDILQKQTSQCKGHTGIKPTNDVLQKAKRCLRDNGIEEDECATVLQALCYILLDVEIYDEEKEV